MIVTYSIINKKTGKVLVSSRSCDLINALFRNAFASEKFGIKEIKQ